MRGPQAPASRLAALAVLSFAMLALLAPNASAEPLSYAEQLSDYARNEERKASYVDNAYQCEIELSSPSTYVPAYWTPPLPYEESNFLEGGDMGSVHGEPPTCLQADNDAGTPRDTGSDDSGPVPLSMTMQLDLEGSGLLFYSCSGWLPAEEQTGTAELNFPEGRLNLNYELLSEDGLSAYLYLYDPNYWGDPYALVSYGIVGYGLVELDHADKSVNNRCDWEDFPKTLTMRGALHVLAQNFYEDRSPGGSPPSPCLSPDPSCLEPNPNPPQSTAAPTLSGTAQDGVTLKATRGSWTGTDPLAYSYRWQRCNAQGTGCADVAGARSSNYGLKREDIGQTVRAVVSAQNAVGAGSALSAPSALVAGRPPQNTDQPRIAGVTMPGQTLVVTDGGWKGTDPLQYSYQWVRCGWDLCPEDIPGATSNTYKLTSADVYAVLYARVRAQNAYGNAQANSEYSDVVYPPPTEPPPENTAPPTVSGTARDGQTLTASPGTWTGDEPRVYSYQWRRCNTAGASCADIPGAVNANYALAHADVGQTLRIHVTVTNHYGPGEANSAPTATVQALAPTNTATPVIAGVAREGQTLTASPGSWDGTPPDYAYQWRRCDQAGAGCTDVSGASASTYTLGGQDVGKTLRVLVTASNGAGSAQAGSAATMAVLGSACPEGQQGSAPACLPQAVGDPCPPGQVGASPLCLPPSLGPCPPGQVGSDPVCVSPPPDEPCPPGMVGAAGVCTAPPATEPCPEGYVGAGSNCVRKPGPTGPGSSPTGPLGPVLGMSFDPLAPNRDEPVATVQQPNPGALPVFDTVTPGYFTPDFGSPNPAWNRFQQEGRPRHVAVAVGGGHVYVANQRSVTIFGATSLSYLGQVEEAPRVTLSKNCYYQFRPTGIAYYQGEVFAADACGKRVVVYDSDGHYLRQFKTSLHGLNPDYETDTTSPTQRGNLTPYGLDAAWGEVWVQLGVGTDCERISRRQYRSDLDSPPPYCSLLGVFDAQTGALKALTGHAPRYGCPAGTTSQPAAIATDCAALADPVRIADEETRRLSEDDGYANGPDPKEGTQRYGYFDIATAPELAGVFAQCRLLRRNALLTALSLDDLVTPDLLGDCYLSRYLEGMDSVWGMSWLIAASGEPGSWTYDYDYTTYRYSGHPGRWITEYDSKPLASVLGQAVQPLTVARRWQPMDAQSDSFKDVAYNTRDPRIDWSGNPTRSNWQRGTQCVHYVVSDADVYVVGWRGERWYELARNFESIEFKLDISPANPDGQTLQPVSGSTSGPMGDPCFNEDQIPSGTHTLTAIARVGGRTLAKANDQFRIDHDPPTGALSDPGAFVGGSATIEGTIADSHSGPKDWQLEVSPAGAGAWQNACGLQTAADPTGKWRCQWNTTSYADGRYDLRARMRDSVADAYGGPNLAYTSITTTTVDNTDPTMALSGDLKDAEDDRPVHDGEPHALRVDAQDDPGSGMKSIEILVDGTRRDYVDQPCGGGGCPLSREFSFEPENYLDGKRTIEIVARDHAGRRLARSWNVEIDRDYQARGGADEPVGGDPDVGGGAGGGSASAPAGSPAADIGVPNGVSAVSDEDAPPVPTPLLPCTDADSPANFPVYNVGASFEGLSFAFALRRCDKPFPGELVRANYVSYLYGDCEVPAGEDMGGCSAPLEVQSWPACERNLSTYSEGPGGGPLEYQDLEVRGVPAASFDEGLRIEVYAGSSTIVIFGHDPTQILRAASALQDESTGGPPDVSAAPNPDDVTRDLPEPARGALFGALKCVPLDAAVTVLDELVGGPAN